MDVIENALCERAGIQEGHEDAKVKTNLKFGDGCSLVELISKI